MVMYTEARKHSVVSSALPRFDVAPFVARSSGGLSLHGVF